jgi:hypothetical protein
VMMVRGRKVTTRSFGDSLLGISRG